MKPQEASSGAGTADPGKDTATRYKAFRGACRSCSADILWARTTKGRMIPIDAEPRADGNTALDIVGRTLKAYVLGPLDEPVDGLKYVSHYATCRQAADWRKKR